MVTRADVVAEARTWLGTPWVHQGRLKGVGVDCAGLIVCVARAVGLSAEDMEGYPRRPNGTLMQHCAKQMERVVAGNEGAGDVVLFQWRNEPWHLGFLTDKHTLLHAYAVNRKVCEHYIDEKWRAQIACFYHLIGVE